MQTGIGLFIAAAFAAVLVLKRDRSPVSELVSDDLSIDPLSPPEWGLMDIPEIQIEAPPASNLTAFLYAIRRSEHRADDVESGRDYGLTFGRTEFGDFSDHPTATGEWLGRPLSDVQCRGAGQRVGCKTTAAGAYQINRPTWDEVRGAGAWGPALTDFAPSSQDEAARRILFKIGALSALDSGDIGRATALASKRWASLPGATVGQPTRSADDFIAFFNHGLTLG